jgi:hypothetical protein
MVGSTMDTKPGDTAGDGVSGDGYRQTLTERRLGGNLHWRRSPAVRRSRIMRTGEMEENRAMNKLALVLLVIGPMVALPAIAQSPGAAERARIAGTVKKLDGDRLSVNAADGRTQTVILSADATIYGVDQRRLSDIKPGDFVASGGVRGTDGQIHAV